MMSSGGKPTCFDQDVVAALADLGLALERVGLALLVERHHDHRRAVAPRKLRLLEERRLAFLQRDRVDDRICPARTSARLRSRSTSSCRSSSARARCRARRRSGSGSAPSPRAESSIASSMLTSMICAPLSTCWRATATASSYLLVQDQPRERLRAGDVGALADVDEQRVVVDRQRLEARQPHRRRHCRHRARRDALRSPGPMARMCSGVVPQQPPAMLTKPASANSFSSAK